MTQKMYDSLVQDAEINIRYHTQKLFEAQATLAGLKQITQVGTNIITDSLTSEG